MHEMGKEKREKAMKMLEYALRYRQQDDLIFIGNILFPYVVKTCDQLRQFIEQGYGFQDLPRLKTDDNLPKVAPHIQGHSHDC